MNGFTLIELIIVIVILGILAVVAAPRFIDVSRDAKIAVLNGTEGSIRATLQLLNAKATIQNNLGNNVTITTQYGDYEFFRGFPETQSEATSPRQYFLETFLDLGLAENEVKTANTRTATNGDLSVFESNAVSRVGYGSGDLEDDLCYVEYVHTATSEEVTLTTTQC